MFPSSFHRQVLTALLVKHELAFFLEETEAPNIPSLPHREASLDQDSRRWWSILHLDTTTQGIDGT